ncbi:MAG: amino acid ABC transporter substrate-binding protein [Woeseiaceae bacterium]|jgi:ABC-type amino acid transport substrate-binding protein
MRHIPLLVLALCLATASAAAKELTGTLKRIADTGQIRIGFVPDAPPMSFLDKDGKPGGYSIALCNTVVSAVKVATGRDDLEVSYLPFILPQERLGAIENDVIDIECGASTVTLSRRERVDFSLMTFITGGAVLSLKTSPIPSINDLGKKTIAVIKGTTTHDSLRRFADVNEIKLTLRIIETHAQGIELLAAGKVDGYATDRAMIIGQVLQRPDAAKYTLTPKVFSFEPYGLMLKRGDTDFRLVVDRALASLYRDARIRRIYHDWFGRSGEPLSPIVEAVYEFQAVGE